MYRDPIQLTQSPGLITACSVRLGPIRRTSPALSITSWHAPRNQSGCESTPKKRFSSILGRTIGFEIRLAITYLAAGI